MPKSSDLEDLKSPKKISEPNSIPGYTVGSSITHMRTIQEGYRTQPTRKSLNFFNYISHLSKIYEEVIN